MGQAETGVYVDFGKVHGDFDKIVYVEGYMSDGQWLSELPDYPVLNQARQLDEINRIVMRCYYAGAERVVFKCRERNGNYKYPEYSINDLIKPVIKINNHAN